MQGTFHQYALTAELAKKYSHSTYLASPAHEPERQVVLSVFAASLFRFPHERENWLLKAQCIKRLEHQHLIPILDIGIEKEQPFVVREYLPNRSLRSHLKKLSPHRLELRDALTIVSQVGLALTYAHEHHVFHGNIKPENILFDANGQAILTDFHLVGDNHVILRDQTAEEYAFCYLAPEQFAGTCDAGSDQYALGCLTYELLTGKGPFIGLTLASMVEYQHDVQPAPLSQSIAGLPLSLENAVLKTLAKDPTERFFDCSQFLEVVQSVLLPSPPFPLIRSTRAGKKSHPFHSVRSVKTEDLVSQPAMITPLTQEAPNDWFLTNVFGEEATKISPVSVPESSMHEHSESSRGEMTLSLLGKTNRNMPLARRTWHRGKILLALALFLCVAVALTTYAFWPLEMAQSGTNARSSHKGIQAVIPQIPLQLANTPLTHTPTQLTHTPTQLTHTPTQLTHTPTVQPTLPDNTTTPTAQFPSPTATMSAMTATSYEAEAPQNTLAGGAAVVACASCSGGERVEQIGRGGTLQFNNVNKNNAGTYTLIIYYTNGSGDRTLYMNVNSDSAVAINVLATGTWHTVQTLSITVSLNAGKNTIVFSNANARGPDIDKVVV